MTKWHVLFYATEDGTCEAANFLKDRKTSDREKALAWISQLQSEGPQMPRPYADLLRNGIHEIRLKLSGDQARVLYFFCLKDIIVLTHGFIKTTDKVPEEEIKKAERIREDFLTRFPKKEGLHEILARASPEGIG